MPVPKGSKQEKCTMQRALFREDPEYAKSWVSEHGDFCKGIKMKTTRNLSMNRRRNNK